MKKKKMAKWVFWYMVIVLLNGLYFTKDVWAAQIDIPLKQFVYKALTSPNPFGGGGTKHTRLAVDPINGRIYVTSGDFIPTPNSGPDRDSGRQETYSYSIYDNTWVLEYPYCGPAGDVQPLHPDEVGWVWYPE